MEFSPEHIALRAAFIEAMRGPGKGLGVRVILAVAAYFVGELVAMQDQRKYTPEQVLGIVGKNIEAGNAAHVDALMNARPGGHG